jgi:acetylornithine deacetylase
LRAIPGHDPQAILAPVIEKARAAGIAADIVAAYPGLSLPDAAPLASLASQLSGHSAQTAVSFGTEAGLFQQAGIPAIVCGPGDIARAHRPEEFITTAELDAACAFVMALGARLS